MTTRGDWTHGIAKWVAVAVLGGASLAGMVWSIVVWRARQQAVGFDVENRIDINTATRAQLELLPGIGPQLAARVIADRDEHGLFGSLDDLQRVPGIGPRTVVGIEPYATADQPGAQLDQD